MQASWVLAWLSGVEGSEEGLHVRSDVPQQGSPTQWYWGVSVVHWAWRGCLPSVALWRWLTRLSWLSVFIRFFSEPRGGGR